MNIPENVDMTMPITFDLWSLRSLVATAELGGVTKAAERLGRSTSAVSAQIKKLEDQVGAPLFGKAGRGLALTDTGEALLSYSRRMLELNDEAALELVGPKIEGKVRLGLQEDCGEILLPNVLRNFARSHPRVKVEARIGRNQSLLDALSKGELDFVLAWDDGRTAAYKTPVANFGVQWIGGVDAKAGSTREADPLALCVFEGACWFRSLATTALDNAGRPWRLALTSPSLAGVWAGVSAGLGITARTALGLSPSLRLLDSKEAGLPELASVALVIYRRNQEIGRAADCFATMLVEELKICARKETLL